MTASSAPARFRGGLAALAAARAAAGLRLLARRLLLGLAGERRLLGDQRLAVGLRDLVVVGVDLRERQEAVAVAAVVDERRLQRRLDPGDLGEVDVAGELPLVQGLKVEFLDLGSVHHHHAGLLRVGGVDQHFLVSWRLSGRRRPGGPGGPAPACDLLAGAAARRGPPVPGPAAAGRGSGSARSCAFHRGSVSGAGRVPAPRPFRPGRGPGLSQSGANACRRCAGTIQDDGSGLAMPRACDEYERERHATQPFRAPPYARAPEMTTGFSPAWRRAAGGTAALAPAGF